MPTNQETGDWGELLVTKRCSCPGCKRTKSLIRLRRNFRCADIICDFCGYLAQVKTSIVSSIENPPKTILGGAWGPQKERMDAGIYFPLYFVLRSSRSHAIFYLPTDFQSPAVFEPRTPLTNSAKKAGWQGFRYRLEKVTTGGMVRLE